MVNIHIISCCEWLIDVTAIVPEEDLDLVIRPDGIGAGDSHRYGKNYRPDSLRQCNYCHKPGHVVSQCPVFPRITSLKTHMTGSSRLSVPPDYGMKYLLLDRTLTILQDVMAKERRDHRFL